MIDVMDIEVFPPNKLLWRDRRLRCVLGRGGAKVNKQEGDGATPIGRWPMRRVMYRPDRIAAPQTGLGVHALTPDDGWCDDPAHPAYNTQIKRPFAASYEALWREDAVYDLIIILGHNDQPPMAGLGSAIFMHAAQPGFTPTEGCVALALSDLIGVIEDCDSASYVVIHPPA
jgi:L,D-peptidoglycan transpeptidase YkuD (ErfK/YbiS/YcfS/YnhG family)